MELTKTINTLRRKDFVGLGNGVVTLPRTPYSDGVDVPSVEGDIDVSRNEKEANELLEVANG